MYKRTCIKVTWVLITVFLAFAGSYGQKPKADAKIPWAMTVVVMDGANQKEQAEIPVREAVAFIEAHSRLKIEVRYVAASGRHAYTPYLIPAESVGKRKRFETHYAMMGWNIPQSLIDSLPTSSSYLFLYKLYKRKPAQAGSALPLVWGLKKGGKPRPYATVPVDQWWYVNTPKDGFNHWSAQILTHEIVNTIQAKLEAAPYNCPQLLATRGTPGNVFEAERLTMITSACYAKLGNNAN